jgi:hypothetical protein
MLIKLHLQGFPLFVCTSKQQHFALRILDHFGLSSLFTAIYGDKGEYASHSKVGLLATLWMIDDRVYSGSPIGVEGNLCSQVAFSFPGSPRTGLRPWGGKQKPPCTTLVIPPGIGEPLYDNGTDEYLECRGLCVFLN